MSDPATFRATTLPFDVAWAPDVPTGHTSFTWMGHHRIATPSYSTLLGCVRDETPKVEEKKQQQQQPKKQPQQQQTKKPVAVPADVPEGTPVTAKHLAALNFVVGEIKECVKHPEADSLYIEKIYLGETYGTRTIVSGLVKYLTVEQMVGSKVIVIANFKPSALRGVNSEGMVLCASDADKTHVVFAVPPASAQPGDRIVPVDTTVEFAEPVTEVNPKKANNFWAAIAPQLKTNEKGELVWDTILLGNASGPATATLTGCKVA